MEAQTGIEPDIFNVIDMKASEQAKGSISKKAMSSAYPELGPEGQEELH